MVLVVELFSHHLISYPESKTIIEEFRDVNFSESDRILPGGYIYICLISLALHAIFWKI